MAASRECPDCHKNRTLRTFPARAQRCKTCARKRTAQLARARHILETYEVSAEEWALVIAYQGGVCAGCGEPRRYELNVDHDHKRERTHGMRASLRGGLCRGCNKLLRDCRDSIPRLRGLIAYLEDPPARKVLDDCH